MEFLGLPAELLGNLSGYAVVTLFVVAILTGRLIPRATADTNIQVLKERVADANAEADAWRQAYLGQSKANSTLVEQAQPAVEVSQLLDELLRRAQGLAQ